MSTKIKSLTVPGVLESLSVIRQYVADASAVAGLFPDQTYGLSLAIDEIATNVVMHGYKKSGLTGNISVSAEVSENDITVVLEDTSPEFDARQLAAPPAESLAKPLEERQIGGLGVYLAMQNIDGFDYKRLPAPFRGGGDGPPFPDAPLGEQEPHVQGA